MRLVPMGPNRERGMQMQRGGSERGGGLMLMRPDFGLFGSLHREIDRLFDEFARPATLMGTGAGTGTLATIVPDIDVIETDRDIQIAAELPGLERNDVEISVDDDTLTIRGQKREEQRAGDQQVSEREYGVFLRVLSLPQGIDPSQIQATMSNGVLRIVIPKPEKSQPRRIEVSEAQPGQQAGGDGQRQQGTEAPGTAAQGSEAQAQVDPSQVRQSQPA